MEAAVAGNRVMSFRKLWKGLAALGKTERKRDSLVVSSGSRNQQLAQSQGWNDPAAPVSSGCLLHTHTCTQGPAAAPWADPGARVLLQAKAGSLLNLQKLKKGRCKH